MTNRTSDELTEYIPQAAPSIDTDTPFNSIGSEGARFDSDAFALLTVALVTVPKLPFADVSSPAATPTGLVVGLMDALGDGLGLGLGEGVGLTDGLGVAVGLATGTLIELAPVNSENPDAFSEVIAGDNS